MADAGPRVADIAVIGGGPAGLHAALKGALLNHSVALFDKGQRISRVYWVHAMVNIPGFPEGITGRELLDRQWKALEPWKERIGIHRDTEVVDVRRTGRGKATVYELAAAPTKNGRTIPGAPTTVHRTRSVVVATGVVDAQPLIKGKVTTIYPYANTGLLDYCCLCDGHSMGGKRIAVIGHTKYAALSCVDLAHFGAAKLTVFTHDKRLFEGQKFSAAETRKMRADLERRGIEVIEGAITALGGYEEKRLDLTVAGRTYRYDRGFVAIGWHLMNTRLATSLGGILDKDGYVVTDHECRVLDRKREPIPGLYCIGDVRNNWNQIPVIWGDAERAVIDAWAHHL